MLNVDILLIFLGGGGGGAGSHKFSGDLLCWILLVRSYCEQINCFLQNRVGPCLLNTATQLVRRRIMCLEDWAPLSIWGKRLPTSLPCPDLSAATFGGWVAWDQRLTQ